MAYELSKPASKAEPCPICGKTDHCWSAYYGPKNGWLHYCGEKHCSGFETVFGKDGRKYLLKNNSAFPGGKSNGYFVYESEEQQKRLREEYIKELKASNPNYNGGGYPRREVSPRYNDFTPSQQELIEVDHVNPLPNKKLHEVYSYLLSLLILEENHKKALLDEWNAGLVNPNLGEELLAKWPIRSLPMNDYARKNCGIQLKNTTRREIIQKMVNRFGSLKGVPGFYLETTRWTDKVSGQPKTHTHWQMVGLSGIVFPCYDSEGYIVRIRIGDEHPRMDEYAKNPDGSYQYEYREKRVYNPNGTYTTKTIQIPVIGAEITWDYRTGEWYRKSLSTGQSEVIYSLQKGIKKYPLTLKGYPKIDGKVDGKYKNFSSYNQKIKEDNGKRIAYNSYADGCQSGSPLSLYTKNGDDMRFVYITEGEKKAMVINHFLRCPSIALPGVHTFSKLFDKEYGKGLSMMDWLKGKGLEAAIVVYDADKNTNDAVLSAEKGAIEKCHSYGIVTYVGEWDQRYGKGADDVLIQGKNFEFYER